MGALAPTTRPRPEHVPKPGTGISVTMESTKLAEKQRKKDLNKNKAFRPHGDPAQHNAQVWLGLMPPLTALWEIFHPACAVRL